MDTKIDGRQATQKVRQYFLETGGEYGVMSFEVENVDTDKISGDWIVRCAFFPSVNAPFKSHYQVVLSDNGEIRKVDKLTKAQF